MIPLTGLTVSEFHFICKETEHNYEEHDLFQGRTQTIAAYTLKKEKSVYIIVHYSLVNGTDASTEFYVLLNNS